MSAPFLFVPVFSWPAAPGGLLYTYVAGTSNINKQTFADPAGTVINQNPVELDSTGSAIVRLDEGSYHCILKDSTGTDTLWDADYYDAPYLTQQDIGQLFYPITTDEDNAGVIPVNYAYQQGDSRRYGVIGDGLTDNTQALLNTIAVAEAAGGGVFSLPEGTILFSSALTFPTNTILEGKGHSVTLLRATGGCNGVILPAGVGRAGLRKLALYSNTVATGVGIQIGDATGQSSIDRFDDLVVNGWATGILINGAIWLQFENVEVTLCTYGVDFHAGSNSLFSTTVSFWRCIITGNTNGGVTASNVPVANEVIGFYHCTIQLNSVSSPTTPELTLSDGTNGAIDVVFDNCYFEGAATTITTLDVKYLAYLRISNCLFTGSRNYAIRDSVGATVTRAQIFGNDIGACTTASIYMTSETDVWEFGNGYSASSATVTGSGCSSLTTGSGIASAPALNAAYGTTPTLTDGTHTATATTSASYSKVGNIVSFKLQIATSALNSASGSMTIAHGLPIASATGSEDTFPVTINGWTPASSETYMTATAAAGGTTLSLYGGGIASLTAIQAAALSATTTLYISGTYQAAS